MTDTVLCMIRIDFVVIAQSYPLASQYKSSEKKYRLSVRLPLKITADRFFVPSRSRFEQRIRTAESSPLQARAGLWRVTVSDSQSFVEVAYGLYYTCRNSLGFQKKLSKPSSVLVKVADTVKDQKGCGLVWRQWLSIDWLPYTFLRASVHGSPPASCTGPCCRRGPWAVPDLSGMKGASHGVQIPTSTTHIYRAACKSVDCVSLYVKVIIECRAYIFWWASIIFL